VGPRGASLAAGILFAATVCAAAEAPSPQQLGELIERLGSARQVDRAAAARELEALGPAVLPRLPATDAVDDPAVRDALARVRKALEKRLAAESTHSATVTLIGDKSIAQMLEELEAQSGNRIRLAEGVSPPEGFSVDWRSVGFWTTIEAIRFARGWQPRWNAKERRWELAPPKEGERDLAAAVSGPFRVAVRSAAWKTLPDADRRLLRIGLVVQAESRLRPLFLAVSPDEWSGQLGATPLSAWNPTAEYELSFGEGGAEVAWNLDLVVPPEARAADVLSLQGTARVHLAAGMEPFVFDAARLQRGAIQRRGDVALRVRPAVFDADADGQRRAVVRMTLSYPQGGPAFESHRVGMFHRHARLERADGTSIPFDAFEVTTEADGGVALRYEFRGLTGSSSDYRFAYDAPTLLLDVPVGVQFAKVAVKE
jgi:hypothetical protein